MLIVPARAIREIDRRAIEEYGIPGLVLMENAGRSAAEQALAMLREPAKARVLILCGRGNNGGDGFVIGRHLHNHGVAVEFWYGALLAPLAPAAPTRPAGNGEPGEHAAETKSDAAVNLAIIRRMGLPLRAMPEPGDVPADGIPAGRYELLIDALLGTGLSGEVRQPYRALIEAMNAAAAPVLAVDTPSGLEGDTGRVLGVAVRATVTVTFAAAKPGFFRGDGPAHVGRLLLADIGCPRELVEQAAEVSAE